MKITFIRHLDRQGEVTPKWTLMADGSRPSMSEVKRNPKAYEANSIPHGIYMLTFHESEMSQYRYSQTQDTFIYPNGKSQGRRLGWAIPISAIELFHYIRVGSIKILPDGMTSMTGTFVKHGTGIRFQPLGDMSIV
ncbi:hypothetical protein CPT_Muldoon_233 [Serratia phage Muldoon]|uniref:Uncharacterized protein n=1 Tax=Serratia phage Muldoon TaxID=2601678 RepID=A0A5P8PHN8_9CAUD|nr:hypothetical protein HYP94_gp157 [Serratia phage Muldoon]QFR56184.1 hypothetical protein CPT_Muldoon_233 [Serratia phage Muldoon]